MVAVAAGLSQKFFLKNKLHDYGIGCEELLGKRNHVTGARPIYVFLRP